MKKIRHIVPYCAATIVGIFSIFSTLTIFPALVQLLITYYSNSNPYATESYELAVANVTLDFWIVALTALVASQIIHIAISALINRILGCNINASTSQYPKAYCTSSHEFSNEDRLNSVQSTWSYYRRAYEVLIELTTEEMTEILRYMELYNEQYYTFPKSFLMPDKISWFQPKISLRTVRHIIRESQSDGVVLLRYKCSRPKKGRNEYVNTKIHIKANLHCDTYTSKDVFIGPTADG